MLVLTNLMGSSYAAVGDLFARTKQSSREYRLDKINEAESKTKELLSSLRTNASCLVRGNCPPEKKKRLRAIAGAIAAAVVVIASATIVSKSLQEKPQPEITVTGSPGHVEIKQFYPAYDPRQQNNETALLQATNRGQMSDVAIYADKVKTAVLDAGARMAAKLANIYVGGMMKDSYLNIKSYLEQLRKANDLLIEKANAGVLDKVQEVYCDTRMRPSPWAVEESIRQAQEKMQQFQEGQTERKLFTSIVNFLRNPGCPAR